MSESLSDRLYQLHRRIVATNGLKWVYYACYFILLFTLLIRTWILLTPYMIEYHTQQLHKIYGDAIFRHPSFDPTISYDVIPPNPNYDFPITNVHLTERQPTYPDGYFITPSTEGYADDAYIHPLDAQHRHLLPSLPYDIEGSLHKLKFWNPTPIALPYNPHGFRYFMTRRDVGPMGEYLRQDRFAYQRGVLNEEPTINPGTSFQLTCFSDWFPIDLVKDQINEAEQWYQKEIIAKKQPNYVNTRNWGPRLIPDSYDEERDIPLRVVINTTRIDKEKLAKYYGYNTYADMPFHPRIPTKNTNTTWTHRCITPWVRDKNKITTELHQNTVFLGVEDTRLTYDRCGRIHAYWGHGNDLSPFPPLWLMKTVDLRRLEIDDLLFRPLSDLCSLKYTTQQPLHLLDGGLEGHWGLWYKNWSQLPYGFGPNAMKQLTLLKHIFTQQSNIYDFRTNSLFISLQRYKTILNELHPKKPIMYPPWRWEQLQTGQHKGRFENPPDDTTIEDDIITYLEEPHTYITQLAPLIWIQGSKKIEEQPITTKDTSLRRCFLSFNDFRPKEVTHLFIGKRYHGTANHILIYISDEEWAQDPFFHQTPVEKRTNWVYFGAGNDRSTKAGRFPAYRPFITMYNALTLELIAIRPFIQSTPRQCSGWAPSCRYGQGSNCNDICGFVYLHYLTVIQTPLTFSILSDEKQQELYKIQQLQALEQPPTESLSTHSQYNNFDSINYDRQYAKSDTTQQQSTSTQSNHIDIDFFQEVLRNDFTTQIPISTSTDYDIPSTSRAEFTNSKHYPQQQQQQNEYISSSTILQSLHSVLPTYYTLDTQVFAVLNGMDTSAFAQELDLRAFWRQRHPCDIALDITKYPKSIIQVPLSSQPIPKVEPLQQRPSKMKRGSITTQYNVIDFQQTASPPLHQLPINTPFEWVLPFLPPILNFWYYVNHDDYAFRANITLLIGFISIVICGIIIRVGLKNQLSTTRVTTFSTSQHRNRRHAVSLADLAHGDEYDDHNNESRPLKNNHSDDDDNDHDYESSITDILDL